MKTLMRCLVFPAMALMIGLAVSGSTKEAAKIATNALADPIKIDTGYISGSLIGDVGKEVRIYRGIPFAAPPVGDLRWKPPQPAAPWQGIRESTAFGKACPQSFPSGLPKFNLPPCDLWQSEDCLHLNVLTPAKKVSENMMAMWTQFARTGDPNVKGLINWPTYDSATDQYLYIEDTLQVKSGFSKVAQKQ